MTIDHTVNDLLEGGGKALSYDGAPPIIHKGTIISATTSQQTDPKGNLRFFPKSNDPMMQVVITLQTEYQDNPTDDGVRRLFVKSGALNALREALRAANAKLEQGGTLALQYYADEPSDTPGYNPKKVYRAQYRPPAPTQTANDLLGTDSATTATNVSSATWAADGGTPQAEPAGEPFDPFVDR